MLQITRIVVIRPFILYLFESETSTVRRADLEARLVEQSPGDDRESWDSQGLELITRKMYFDQLDSSFVEIDKHLSALKDKNYVDLMSSV